ncbi:MAG TPA: glycosyltransferase [Nitrospinota bacterium]|nr:glycosyltransferase [Nitrospinota bacterium]|tara:strand:- start:130717 stop:131841 length:1125 start_codon:yes stop_codon:yes gene_type:complete
MKVALVHDWLTGMRGGEKVLEVFCEMYPKADIFTLVHIPNSVSEVIESHQIYTSFLQKMPDISRKYRWYLPLMPLAIESFILHDYDLVLSSSHCVAKGVKPSGTPHISYCHTPMRYAWDQYNTYFNRSRFSPALLYLIGKVMPHMRKWDRKSASRVDMFIANSQNVSDRIRKCYRVEAKTIYPPVDTSFYELPDIKTERKKYLVVSSFAPYKRIDLTIRAFNKLGEPLVIVGSGEDEKHLKEMARPNIEFLESVSNKELKLLYQSAKALIYPGEEDFGIIPVEAMACGTPVIAFGRGGALETVIPLSDTSTAYPTGVYFDEQTPDDLIQAIGRFEKHSMFFLQEKLRNNAKRFSRELFRNNMERAIEEFVQARH